MAMDHRRADHLDILRRGDVEVLGRMPWSSNHTFLVNVSCDGVDLQAVYKPGRGERSLWDFPDGLYRREVAAYELAVALGWIFVPETILRADAPLGRGSLQRFVDADFEQHYFTLMEEEEYRSELRRMACFDLLANNADRKGGHCLVDAEGRLWGIDHGLCFHPEPKLRTVMWDFAGDPIDEELLADVRRLGTCGLPAALTDQLHDEERLALASRIRELLRIRHFPHPRSGHPYPWPLV
jgi:uncharacterized repeat protein (TIGR03843 family)